MQDYEEFDDVGFKILEFIFGAVQGIIYIAMFIGVLAFIKFVLNAI